jgi:crotonobetainyl-CoA:carnitine CoA-transferase CaiB-like acyl-CoA transferase
MANQPGHDLNFIALNGVLHALGRADGPPTPPMNLLANFAGGAFFAAIGILSALVSARSSGVGQIVDASMLHGTAYLATTYYSWLGLALVNEKRGTNLVDGGNPLYDVYQCSDGRYLSVAPMEAKFRDALAVRLGVKFRTDSRYRDSAHWMADRSTLTSVFMTRTRDEWTALLGEAGVCVVPVLSPFEASRHPHNAAQAVFYEGESGCVPLPGPNFSVTSLNTPRAARQIAAEELCAVAEYWRETSYRTPGV